MQHRFEMLSAGCLAFVFSLASSDLSGQTTATPMSRALDRAVTRVNSRSDLAGHRGAGFNRDSFDLEAMRGLGKTSDSTLIGWFSGFASYVNGTDSTACHGLVAGEPTGTHIASVRSSMDSAALESWISHWETAVVASYLSPAPPPVDEEAMMVALFTLIAKLPDSPAGQNRKPGGKPPKPSPAAECNTMRHFFAEALALEDSTRMTLFRGLALTMNEKGKSSFNIEK